MKKIKLTKNYHALVSDIDYKTINSLKWRVLTTKDPRHTYAISSTKKSYILMHRLIKQCPDGVVIDHKNGNTLDNRRSNLRIATLTQNGANRIKSKNSTTGYKGVTYFKLHPKKPYRAQIKHKGKVKHIGCYETAAQAHSAYLLESKKLHGKFHNSG